MQVLESTPSIWRLEHILYDNEIHVGDITEVDWVPTAGQWYYAAISCNDKCDGMQIGPCADFHVAYHFTAISNFRRIQQEGLTT
eukprot:1634483-Karenia_brevis.AAC.1